jgi:hypothetical protein
VQKHLHIVCLQIPYPANNGAAIEMLNKIIALHAAGIQIHLHCYTKKNSNLPIQLQAYCHKVFYYQRNWALPIFKPYIVTSRNSKALLQYLNTHNYPILFEGVHTTNFLLSGNLQNNQKKIVRLHNVEYLYYNGLAKSTNFGFKKLYFLLEAHLLKKYESKLAATTTLCAISHFDAAYFTNQYQAKNICTLAPFITHQNYTATATGNFYLYHGNLSVPENETVVLQLIKNVFSKTNALLTIAGQNPSHRLYAAISAHKNVQLVANPNAQQMQQLQVNAIAHILPSINSTGVKFKILNAISMGAVCITNTAGAAGLASSNLVVVAINYTQMLSLLQTTLPKNNKNWQTFYNNTTGVKQLINLLF